MAKLEMERAGGWFKYIRSARYLPGRIIRVIVATTPPPHKSGPISVLPSELLHAVFELLEFSDHNTLWNCMRVCRRWHHIARPHFFAIVPVTYHHRKRFSKHFRAHPELGAHVKALRFVDNSWTNSDDLRHRRPGVRRGPFHIQLLASTLPLLPNLRDLSLVGYDNSSKFPLVQCQRTSVSLRRLSFHNCVGLPFILLEVLSLLSLDTLVVSVDLPDSSPHTDTPVPWSRCSFPRTELMQTSITIQNLVLRGCVNYPSTYYDTFELFSVPGSLRALDIAVYNQYLLRNIPTFLRSRAARDLLSLSVDLFCHEYGLWQIAVPPYLNLTGAPTVFHILGAAITHCTRLQCVRIGFAYVGSPERDPVSQRDALLPMLESLPTTLRVFAIRIRLRPWRSWRQFCADAAVGLDVVDRLLSPSGDGGGKFPNLRSVELHIVEDPRRPGGTTANPLEEDDDLMLLPRLRAAGLLRFVHAIDRGQVQGK
ncbi:hypothetical protein LXA43DRAFT_131358 [Ganoderma leucocontextum]|nr:hypothetical protein LXA43DRAFT_131358 [Ganoderma leucocontextum]